MPKIANFNKARFIKDCTIKKLSPAEQRHYAKHFPQIAPEVVSDLTPKTPESDIYSFGYLIRMITRARPSEFLSDIAYMCLYEEKTMQ